MVRDISEVQENRGWSAEIIVRSEKSKMVNMADIFLENGCIHQISCHSMLLLGFWTQNDYIRGEEIQTKCFMPFYHG